jgi:prophage regulatory protein
MYTQTPRLLTIKHVCKLVNRDRRTIWKWVKDGLFIEPVKMQGRTIGFKEKDLIEWIENNGK